MLTTLLKIGEWQSQGKSEWDRFLDYPKVDYADNTGNTITNYTLSIIFDLDGMDVIIDTENLKEYDESDIRDFKAIKIKGGNNKAIYNAVPGNKLVQIYKTFFGKEAEETKTGELMEAFSKTNLELLTPNFKKLLSEIFLLKERFLELTVHPEKHKIDLKTIEESFNFSRSENIILLVTKVKAEKFGYKGSIFFSEIPEYKAYLEKTFLNNSDTARDRTANKKLCYASGGIFDDVKELNLSARYSLNKMFVTETKNYASLFNKNKFSINYQVSSENQEKLDYASDYLLNHGYKVKIAGLDHIIIPQFQHNSDIDLKMALDGIKLKSDILFSFHKLSELSESITDETHHSIFWINFIAFESDGNFFKSTEIIKDVSNFHFNKILQTFNEINWEFYDAEFTDWNAVTTEYDYESKVREPRNLNFNSLFKLIPLRKDKEKKNKALELFKAILENRKVKKEILYDYFCELIRCHWFERYGSYKNIAHYSKDYFYIAVRDSVFKYYAFIQVLQKLNLIDMEETNVTIKNTTGNKYDNAIHHFFEKMALSKDQQAMFYLGRLLNSVEYIQKGKTKTVIQKVNFNGMDKDSIQRLRVSLIEKAKQYNAMSKVIFTDNKFGELFDFNNWNMKPNEAVFFLLTGYSFGIGIKDADKLAEKEAEIPN